MRFCTCGGKQQMCVWPVQHFAAGRARCARCLCMLPAVPALVCLLAGQGAVGRRAQPAELMLCPLPALYCREHAALQFGGTERHAEPIPCHLFQPCRTCWSCRPCSRWPIHAVPAVRAVPQTACCCACCATDGMLLRVLCHRRHAAVRGAAGRQRDPSGVPHAEHAVPALHAVLQTACCYARRCWTTC